MALLLAELPAVLLILATSLILIGERRVHSYNYSYLKAVGGEELIPKPMQTYYYWIVLLPYMAWITSLLLSPSLRLESRPIWGAPIIILSVSLRIWSIRALGRLWCMRCIYIDGMPRSANGPYRLISHPEYLSRAVEGLGFLIFFGVNPISSYVWVRTILGLSDLLKTESRQLYELSVAPLQFDKASSRVGASKL